MTAKKTAEREQLDILNEVNRVPMTEESRKRMSLNIYDLQYLIRLQEMSNDAFREELQELYEKDNENTVKLVVEAVTKQLAETFTNYTRALEELSLVQNEIKEGILKLTQRIDTVHNQVFVTDEKRITYLEKYAGWFQTMMRGAAYVVMAVILTLLLIDQKINRRIENIEKILQEHTKTEQAK